MALVKPLHSGDPDVMCNSHAATCLRSNLRTHARTHAHNWINRIIHNPPSWLGGGGGAVAAAQIRSLMATKYAIWMALCIEYSPAMQESRVRFPAETTWSQKLYAKDVDGSGQASTWWGIAAGSGIQLKKCWRTIEILGHCWNVGTLPKCWRSKIMLALYQYVGALWKCWRTIEMLALYQNAGTLWKCWRTTVLKCWRFTNMLALYENVGTL
jgi:hypothetical protein